MSEELKFVLERTEAPSSPILFKDFTKSKSNYKIKSSSYENKANFGPFLHSEHKKSEKMSKLDGSTNCKSTQSNCVDFGTNGELDEKIYGLFVMYKERGYGVSSEELKNFVDFYCSRMLEMSSWNSVRNCSSFPPNPTPTWSLVPLPPLACPACFSAPLEPLTLPCGHTYCRRCIGKEDGGVTEGGGGVRENGSRGSRRRTCRVCPYVFKGDEGVRIRNNVLISSLIEKWWNGVVECGRERGRGNSAYHGGRGEEAIEAYTAALQQCEDDHLSYGNRAQAYNSLGAHEEALRDGEEAIKCCPIWAKGYYRKSLSLLSLGRYEEALISLSICLYLIKVTRPNDESALLPIKSEFMKVLPKVFLKCTLSSSGENGGRERSTSFIKERENVSFSPYPTPTNRRTWRDDGDYYYSSSGEEDHSPTKRHNSIGKRSGGGAEGVRVTDLNLVKAHKVFEKAIEEVRKIHKELTDPEKEGSKVSRLSYRPIPPPPALTPSDFECSLCYLLLFAPTTTPCGHSFCTPCLQRSLDHSPSCPLCKSPLFTLLSTPTLFPTHFLSAAISALFPTESEERAEIHKGTLGLGGGGGGRGEVLPIFVCTVAFPTVSCPLHIFEPRYKLMIRRVMMSGTRQFGMCCYSAGEERDYSTYGTVLEIRNVQFYADGRSVIDTIGVKRFRVLERGERDGFNIATVEFLHDTPISSPDIPRLTELHAKLYTDSLAWFNRIDNVLRQRILSNFGPMPLPPPPSTSEWEQGSRDGPSWLWWLIGILPLSNTAQMAFLGQISVLKRVESLIKVLDFINSSEGRHTKKN